MAVNLGPDVEKKLREIAKKYGGTPGSYAKVAVVEWLERAFPELLPSALTQQENNEIHGWVKTLLNNYSNFKIPYKWTGRDFSALKRTLAWCKEQGHDLGNAHRNYLSSADDYAVRTGYSMQQFAREIVKYVGTGPAEDKWWGKVEGKA